MVIFFLILPSDKCTCLEPFLKIKSRSNFLPTTLNPPWYYKRLKIVFEGKSIPLRLLFFVKWFKKTTTKCRIFFLLDDQGYHLLCFVLCAFFWPHALSWYYLLSTPLAHLSGNLFVQFVKNRRWQLGLMFQGQTIWSPQCSSRLPDYLPGKGLCKLPEVKLALALGRVKRMTRTASRGRVKSDQRKAKVTNPPFFTRHLSSFFLLSLKEKFIHTWNRREIVPHWRLGGSKSC